MPSALPSRCRDRGCCSDPLVAFSAPMIPAILQLVGAFSSSTLCPSLLRRQRGWNLCVMGCWRLIVGVLVFSALLHWLKGLRFEAPDPSLVYESDFVPDVACFCSFLHVAGFSGSQLKRTSVGLVLCFSMSCVPIVPSL